MNRLAIDQTDSSPLTSPRPRMTKLLALCRALGVVIFTLAGGCVVDSRDPAELAPDHGDVTGADPTNPELPPPVIKTESCAHLREVTLKWNGPGFTPNYWCVLPDIAVGWDLPDAVVFYGPKRVGPIYVIPSMGGVSGVYGDKMGDPDTDDGDNCAWFEIPMGKCEVITGAQ